MPNCPNCNAEIEENSHYCEGCGYNLKETVTIVAEKKRPRSGDTFATGIILGERFKIIELLGRGNIGYVYRARDTHLEETVAVKVLKQALSEDKEMVDRFKREIKVARKVKHPYVCNIFDYGTFDNLFYISMAFVDGENLDVLLEENRIPEEQFIPLINNLALALSAAHRENIVHRDLKPSSIKITDDFKPVIMDFGVARYVGNQEIALSKENLGAPEYMSPEQFKSAPVDQRSDIYSFGVIIYRLVAGKLPFSGSTPIELAISHLQNDPVPPRQIRDNIPQYLENIILKCLEKDPNKRFQNSGEILAALESSKSSAKPDLMTTSGNGYKILIADDDEDIRSLLSMILKKDGFETILAEDGHEAISKAMNDQPSLICLDLMMPTMDGYQAAEFLRFNEKTAHIPIVMITCKTEKEYRAYSKTIGVKDYLTKPLDLHTLVARIKEILKEE